MLPAYVVCSFTFPMPVPIAISELREGCHTSSDSNCSGWFGNSSLGEPSTQMMPSHVSEFHSFSCPDLGKAPHLGGELNLKRLVTLKLKSWASPSAFFIHPMHIGASLCAISQALWLSHLILIDYYLLSAFCLFLELKWSLEIETRSFVINCPVPFKYLLCHTS